MSHAVMLFFVVFSSPRTLGNDRQTAEVETLRARLRHTERLHKEQMDVERRQRAVAAEETSAERRRVVLYRWFFFGTAVRGRGRRVAFKTEKRVWGMFVEFKLKRGSEC